MRQARWIGCVLLAVSLVLSAAYAGNPGGPRVNFKDMTLSNGLRVITVEDHTAPVVSLCVTYNVGSRNEVKGRTGFAHLFEHMMFKGSANVGSGEHFILISNSGGQMNGTTTEDRTNYFEEVPANQLDMILFLESDRMRGLDITQANLDNQRNAVQEERRLGVDNQPYGESEEKMQDLLYDNFAYKHTTIGSMEDLNAASIDDVKAFFKMYYAPNNAVLVLVGDFDPGVAMAKLKDYFESIPRQPDPPKVDMSEPEQTAERSAKLEDKLATVPQIDIAYKAVPGNSADFYALQVLSAALQSGQSSRLYQSLVKDKQLAQQAYGYVDEKRGTGALYTIALVNPGKKIEDAEAVIDDEVERLKREPIADWELAKGKNATKQAVIRQMQSSLFTAILLGQYTVFYNDPSLINTRIDKVEAVTKADVQRVANKYLRSTNRTVVITVPKTGAGNAAALSAGTVKG
jgi:zinc protease